HTGGIQHRQRIVGERADGERLRRAARAAEAAVVEGEAAVATGERADRLPPARAVAAGAVTEQQRLGSLPAVDVVDPDVPLSERHGSRLDGSSAGAGRITRRQVRGQPSELTA